MKILNTEIYEAEIYKNEICSEDLTKITKPKQIEIKSPPRCNIGVEIFVFLPSSVEEGFEGGGVLYF